MSDLNTVIDRYDKFLTLLPAIIADEIIDWVLDNYDSESWEGQRWPERKDGDTSRALLIGHRGGRGRRSIRVTSRTAKKVTIGTDLEYMIAHNDGAEISRDITPRMRKFFWAMHFKHEVDRNGELKVSEDQVRWKWMALKKGRITFRMPKRQFMGPSEELDQRLKEAIEYELNQIFK